MNLNLTIARSAATPQPLNIPPIDYRIGSNSGSLQIGGDTVSTGARQAVLIAGSDSFVLDITDPVMDVQNAGETVWTEVQRPDALSWLVRSGGRLKSIRFRGLIYRGGEAIDVHLSRLEYMSTREPVITFAYGAYEAGQWRMTALSFQTTIREPGTNNVTAASFECELTRANDIPKPKPVPSAPPPPPPAAVLFRAASNNPAPTKATYVVKKGDTLWVIAQQFYGNDKGNQWPRIADANGIKDPRRIAVGQSLVIPQ